MKYSIIIPTHNRPDLLQKNLRAFSDLKNSEIIVIENNSNEINIKKYNELNVAPNTKIFHYKIDSRLPLSKARNLGISLAKGEYVFMIDDDDIPTKEFIDFLNNAKELAQINRFSLLVRNRIDFNASRFNRITFMDKVQISTFLIKREILNEVNFRENVKFEDNHFAADLIQKFGIKAQKKFKIVSAIYAISEQSMMTSKQSFDDWSHCLSVGRFNDPFKFKQFITMVGYFSKSEIKLAWNLYFKKYKLLKAKMSPYYAIRFILWKFFRFWW